jgi:hypothetical protein
MMTRGIRSCCGWCVIFCFLFGLLSPDPALGFDTDTLKTAGIVSGITIGVALVVILVAGTMRDMKKDRRDEDEDDDVWSRSPLLRTLGYRPCDDPLLGPSPGFQQEDPGSLYIGRSLLDQETLWAFRGREIHGGLNLHAAHRTRADEHPTAERQLIP